MILPSIKQTMVKHFFAHGYLHLENSIRTTTITLDVFTASLKVGDNCYYLKNKKTIQLKHFGVC